VVSASAVSERSRESSLHGGSPVEGEVMRMEVGRRERRRESKRGVARVFESVMEMTDEVLRVLQV